MGPELAWTFRRIEKSQVSAAVRILISDTVAVLACKFVARLQMSVNELCGYSSSKRCLVKSISRETDNICILEICMSSGCSIGDT